jgi:hypothetical protein
MAGSVAPDAVFSALTVAFLEDTGWYRVSFSVRQLMLLLLLLLLLCFN